MTTGPERNSFTAIFWELGGPKVAERKSPQFSNSRPEFFEPEVLQSGFGVNFLFGPAKLGSIAGECLSEF